MSAMPERRSDERLDVFRLSWVDDEVPNPREPPWQAHSSPGAGVNDRLGRG